MPVKKRRRTGTLLLAAVLAGAFLPPGVPAQAAPATVRLDPSTTYQTMIGWEGLAWIGQFHPKARLWRDRALDLAVNDLGLNRLRVEIHCGAENPDSRIGDFLARRIEDKLFQCFNNSTTNDNDDPFRVNASGFDFRQIDLQFDQVVVPMRALLAARGERLFLNFCYVAFTSAHKGPLCPPGLRNHHRNPEEYAEFVRAVCDHIREKYGLTPDTWELLLEPDNRTEWTGAELGRALVAAGKRLRAGGYATTFVVGSGKTLANSVVLFDEIAAVPGALEYISEIAYHRYGGAIERKLGELVERAKRYKLRTGMLEHIGSGYENLHTDLKLGMVSSWEQYTIAGPRKGDPGGRYYLVDAQAPGGPTVRDAKRTPFLRQYFRYIRRGAVRIDAKSTDRTFDPLGFVNTDGRYVVVVKAEAGGQVSIAGLPAGTYGITYTTDVEAGIGLPDVTVGNGQPLLASLPARGVMTVFARRPR
jgi:hypothetical protein